MEPRGISLSHRRAILAIALLALALRLGFVLARDLPLFSDEIDYDRLGRTLASTGRYTDEGAPTGYRAIGYPALVGAVYALAGPRPVAVHVLQAILDATSTLLLFLLAGGGRLGLLAAGFWAVCPVAILYTDLLMPETAFTTTLLAAACVTRHGFPRTAPRALALGALVGTAALIRPAALLLIVALPLAARLESVRVRRKALLLAGLLLLVGPWLLRNAIVLGYPGMATSTGANLLIGNNPNATGGYSPHVPEEMIPDGDREAERDVASIGAALHYAWREPGRTVVIGFAGLAHLFGSEAGMTVWAFHPDPADPSTRLRQKIRSLPGWVHALMSGPTMVAMLAGVLGFFLAPRGSARVWFLALLGVLVATHFAFYGGARYRFPLLPFFVLFAAAALDARFRAAPRAPGRLRPLAVIAAWSALLGIWAGELAVVLRA
jgi:hypothetical protein